MKKRVVAFLMALTLFAMGSYGADISVQAEGSEQDIDISYLLEDENALIGYAELQTWGVYLDEGVSVINDAGGGTIGCGGITNASVKCTVSVNAIVERKVNGSWVRVTSWTVTNENAYTAIVSKYLSVGSGYWYRCRCIHKASSDTSNSSTSPLWM